MALSAEQRRIADQLVSVFENGTTRPRYDYVEELGDGRGLTCGKIGFVTVNTEVADVVSAYAAEVPGSALGRHLPRLRELAATGSGETTGLDGFARDWAAAAADPAFRRIQDDAADRLTYDPAVALARRLGIGTPLGVAVLYDSAVQHGMGTDPDGLPALARRAGEAVGGAPADGVPERRWLLAFLDVRADDLRDPHNAESRDVWAQSVDRAEALRRLVEADRQRLAPPVEVTAFGARYVLE